jgi:hypothetical protein
MSPQRELRSSPKVSKLKSVFNGCICCSTSALSGSYHACTPIQVNEEEELTGMIAFGSDGFGAHIGVPGTSMGPGLRLMAAHWDCEPVGKGVTDWKRQY